MNLRLAILNSTFLKPGTYLLEINWLIIFLILCLLLIIPGIIQLSWPNLIWKIFEQDHVICPDEIDLALIRIRGATFVFIGAFLLLVLFIR